MADFEIDGGRLNLRTLLDFADGELRRWASAADLV